MAKKVLSINEFKNTKLFLQVFNELLQVIGDDELRPEHIPNLKFVNQVTILSG